MSNEPAANIRADKATITVSGDKGGTLSFKGGSMDFSAVVQPNQFIQITNVGGSVDVRVKFRSKMVNKWEITETLLTNDSLTEKVNAIAGLFNTMVEED